MQSPTHETVVVDSSKNIRYVILAYRALAAEEARFFVRYAIARMRKKPNRNSEVRLYSIIGA